MSERREHPRFRLEAAVKAHPSMSKNARTVALVLGSYANASGEAWPTYRTMLERFNVPSWRGFKAAVAELEAAGLLRVQPGTSRQATRYVITAHAPDEPGRSCSSTRDTNPDRSCSPTRDTNGSRVALGTVRVAPGATEHHEHDQIDRSAAALELIADAVIAQHPPNRNASGYRAVVLRQRTEQHAAELHQVAAEHPDLDPAGLAEAVLTGRRPARVCPVCGETNPTHTPDRCWRRHDAEGSRTA